mgnify:CR=1 FL=1
MTEIELKNLLKQKSRQALFGELMGGICHELNNPLTILLGNLGILEKFAKKDTTMPSDKILYFTGEMGSSSVRVQKIVATLRALSKCEICDTKENEKIDELVDQIQILLKTKFSKEKVELRLVGFPTQKNLQCSSGLFIEAFLHILINSFEALQECKEKWIQIEFESTLTSKIFYISDSAQIVLNEQYFDDFFTSKQNHCGLGLSLAKANILKHAGTLETVIHHDMQTLKITIPHKDSPV